MTKIVGIVGSLRKKSFNLWLLEAAKTLMPKDSTLEIVPIADIPLYNGDLEEQGTPAAVTFAADRIAEGDGLLFSSPEYNSGIPGVVKNTVDWLSRGPNMKRVFADRPVGLIGATPGPGGTRLAQAAWLPVLRLLGTHFYTGKSVYVAGAANVFAEDGSLKDDKVRDVLTGYLEGFVKFVAKK